MTEILDYKQAAIALAEGKKLRERKRGSRDAWMDKSFGARIITSDFYEYRIKPKEPVASTVLERCGELEVERDKLEERITNLHAEFDLLEQERDSLKAENKELRKDRDQWEADSRQWMKQTSNLHISNRELRGKIYDLVTAAQANREHGETHPYTVHLTCSEFEELEALKGGE